MVAAFVAYLTDRGWAVTTENPDHVDIIATRGAEVLVVEAKGVTSSPGTDVDTLYGQLLRRMARTGDEVSYAVVAPEALASAVLRVPEPVRRTLDIAVFLVDDFGAVRRLDPTTPA